MKKPPSIFGIQLQATQTNIKSREVVSQIIRTRIVEKSSVKTDIQLEKDHKLVCVEKYPICIKCPQFLTFVYPLQNNYKVSSIAKNYALLFSPNNYQQENYFCNKTNYTRHKFITHKNNCCQAFSRSRNDQSLFGNEYNAG